MSLTSLRLPTEAEWEFACRAGTTTARYGVLNDVAWYNGNAGPTTPSVATKLPNALGLYDTLGNVREWCQDWYGSTYYATSSSVDPIGPSGSTFRVIRNASYLRGGEEGRSSSRSYNYPSVGVKDDGFRVARNP